MEQKYAAVKAQFPQLAGKKAVVAAASSAGTGGYFVWTSGDNRGKFLTDLGMTVPAAFDQAANGNFYADLSSEQLSMLDQNDVVAWLVIPGTANGRSRSSPDTARSRSGRRDGS